MELLQIIIQRGIFNKSPPLLFYLIHGNTKKQPSVIELDDEALDQVSGGLKRLDSDWKPEITEICKLCGSTRNVRGGLCLACKNKC